MEKNSGTVSTVSCTLQVLAGRPGTVGTWSIEKPVRLTDDDIDEDLLYGILRNFVLTEEQLVENGYPRPDPNVSILWTIHGIPFERVERYVGIGR